MSHLIKQSVSKLFMKISNFTKIVRGKINKWSGFGQHNQVIWNSAKKIVKELDLKI